MAAKSPPSSWLNRTIHRQVLCIASICTGQAHFHYAAIWTGGAGLIYRFNDQFR